MIFGTYQLDYTLDQSISKQIVFKVTSFPIQHKGVGIVVSMPPTGSRLYVDVGQTGSRVEDTVGTRHHLDIGFAPGVPLHEVIQSLLLGLENRSAESVLLSMTGLRGKVPDLAPIASVCEALTGCQRLGVCDDGLAWSVGSLAGADGVSLAVGGGVVGVSRKGQAFFHLDGNGSDFGDSGGAFWLGRKGIRASIRAIEESDRGTELAEEFLQHFGAHDDFVRQDLSRAQIHAAFLHFSSAVLDAAENGDLVAADIVGSGASRLAELVMSAAVKAQIAEAGVTVSLGGGLMKGGFYRELVKQKILSRDSSFDVIEPLGDALDGLSHLDGLGRKEIVNLMRWWEV